MAASRPSTAASSSGSKPIQGALRPQSAALLLDSPSRQVRASAGVTDTSTAAAGGTVAAAKGGKVGTSSEDLIRDLETKVRKVVEQKRSESDRLRFALSKKRDDVERTKLVLQDLIKESEALGLHYQPLSDNQTDVSPALASRGSHIGNNDSAVDIDVPIIEEPGRLQPIASISRRPVYAKHSNIHELEAKLEKRASETHHVHRRTLVLEHIKKRLLAERLALTHETNELKLQFTDVSHETNELHKKEIAAAEAVSQLHARLAQQRDDIAAAERKYAREVAMRHKWAREKAKFEKYYHDQVLAVEAKQNQSVLSGSRHAAAGDAMLTLPNSAMTPTRHRTLRTGSPTQRNAVTTVDTAANNDDVDDDDDTDDDVYRDAFQRIGFGQHADGVDPDDVIRVCRAHAELQRELEATYSDEIERVAQLRQRIAKARGHEIESHTPLSTRGTSQKLEIQEFELSAVERTLATVMDQYTFVDQSVRPIKIGLQQVLQNVTNTTVNIDDMDTLESALLATCDEMMRLVRASPARELGAVDNVDHDNSSDDSGNNNTVFDGSGSTSTADHKHSVALDAAAAAGFSAESFTSPFNIRVPPKHREPYFVPGVSHEPSAAAQANGDRDDDETDLDVMDRATVKRIASVLLCTNAGKKATKSKGSAHMRG